MKHYERGLSFKGVMQSFRHSFRGFRVLLRNEYNLYIQLIFAIIAACCGFIFDISLLEWALQTTVIGLVIFSELINTAIEKIMDLVNPDYNERVRDIKDLSGGSVLFTVIIAIATGLFIYVPKFYSLILLFL